MRIVAVTALACVLSAQAAAAQRAIITGLNPAGFQELPWGYSQAQVAAHWQETPLEVKRENGLTRLGFLPWLGLQTWSVAVDDHQGFVQAQGTSAPTVTGAACETLYRATVARFARPYRALQPVITERTDGSAPLCDAVRAGHAEASYRWTDPVNGAEAVVEVNREGRVVFQAATRGYREALAASVAQAAAPATAPVAAVAPATTTTAGVTGFNSALWGPAARAIVLPWGATRADVVRVMGREPTLETTRDLGPGMSALYYLTEGVGFTIHQARGLIQAAVTTGLAGPPEPCADFFRHVAERIQGAFPALQPRAEYTHQGSGDLCAAVKSGAARASSVWTDPASGATVSVRVGEKTGAVGVFFATPEYIRWFDSTPEGRSRLQASTRP